MPRWSRSLVALALACVTLAAALLIDIVSGIQIGGLFAAAAVVASVSSRPRPTLVIASLAVLAAAASGIWHGTIGELEWVIRLLGCTVAALASVAAAVLADRHRRATRHTHQLVRRLLDALAVELTGARTVTEVADGFLSQVAAGLGATSAMVSLRDQDDVLRTVSWWGRGGSQADRYSEIPLDADLPGSVAVRSRTPLHYLDRTAIHEAFPDLRGYYSEDRSLHVVPLVHGEEPIGLLALTFAPGVVATDDERGLVVSLAGPLSAAIMRARALSAADAEAQRTAILTEASRTLAQSIDWDETLAEVRRLLVPRLSDWCAVHLLREGTLETVAIWHRDPDLTAWAQERRAGYPLSDSSAEGVAAVVRTGEPQLHQIITTELLDGADPDDRRAALLRRLGLVSTVIAPMRHAGEVVGAVSLAHAESGRRYGEEDVELLVGLAARVATALDNAASFTRQSRRLSEVMKVAAAAQQAILAPPPPRIGPFSLSSRYVSAAEEAQVGGDLYEVVELDDRLRVLIGDVRGKGLAAVRTATIVLGGFRSVAALDVPISEVARQLDRHVQTYLHDEEDFVTAALMDIDPDGTFSLVLCGHPPPVQLHADGWRVLAAPPSVPLGLGAAPEPAQGRLDAGDRLILFTDGLLEARAPDRSFIDPGPLWTTVAGHPFPQLLDAILDAVRLRTGGRLQDDLALLAIEYAAPGAAAVRRPQRVSEVLPAAGASVGRARRLVRTLLEGSSLDAAVDDAQLAISEVVTNALVHAGGSVGLVLDLSESGLRVEVADDNPHVPVRRDYATVAATGRGLHLVDHLVTQWGTYGSGTGKVVWFEIQDALGSPLPVAVPAGQHRVEPATATTGDVAVELRNVPLLLHSAWQEHISALLREYLLVQIDDDPGILDRHAQASDAMNLLHEHLPAPDLGAAPEVVMKAALEPRVSSEVVVVSVPRDVLAHFTTLDELVRETLALAASDPDRMLVPPTQPEIGELSRWLCREVAWQARTGRAPEPWSTPEPTRVVDPALLTIDGWDAGDVRDSPLALIATNETSIVVAVSRPALDVLGFEQPSDLTGRPVTCIVPERYRQAHIAGTTLHVINGRDPLLGVAITVPVVKASGEESPFEMTVSSLPLSTGKRVFVAHLIREVV